MGKYKVLELLSTSGRDIQPGEIIEIEDDQVATNLLNKNCITPAEAPSPVGERREDSKPTKEESK